jgi:hypothetical protein
MSLIWLVNSSSCGLTRARQTRPLLLIGMRELGDGSPEAFVWAFSGLQMRLKGPEEAIKGSSAGSNACSEVVVRGEVEPPTFRFSGLRITVQDGLRRSYCLFSCVLHADRRRCT